MALLSGRAFEAKYRALDALLEKDQSLSENQTFDDIFKHVNMLFNDMKRKNLRVWMGLGNLRVWMGLENCGIEKNLRRWMCNNV